MSLVFKRKKGQSVVIGDIVVMVAEVGRNVCKLVIDAPEGVTVLRGEIMPDVEISHLRPTREKKEEQ